MNIQLEIKRIKELLDQVNDEKLIAELKQLLNNYEAASKASSVQEEAEKYGSSDANTADKLLQFAMNLNEQSRAELAQKLLDSLDQMELETAWLDLAETRLSELESGKAKPIGWNDIKQRVTHVP
ncbi:MAG: addiction module protein [Flavobacteriales bacterium]|nr:addiction module protein [Flavobacteriales bacterium]